MNMIREISRIIRRWLRWQPRGARTHTRQPAPIAKEPAPTMLPTEKQRIAKGVREFFEQNYELRYNVLKQTEEFRPKTASATTFPASGTTADRRDTTISDIDTTIVSQSTTIQNSTAQKTAIVDWQQLSERHLHKIAIEQMEQVGVAWSIDVELYVRSALVPLYNPATDYLDRCGAWDGRADHIRQLARRVPTDYAAWPDVFHRWFLGMVAQWQNLSRDFGNAVVPLLIGGQGTHKSTFCRLLLPPELREYYIDDIKLDNAEQVERMLSRMLLANIDEYNAKTDREQAKIKRVLTEKDVQTRRMRSDQYMLLPRMASFIATTNEHEPLCDPTGSRRYLCCEVTGIIDTDAPIDYRQLYAQAVAELRQGHPYHFSKDEEANIERHNQQYRRHTAPEEVLRSYFEPAERKKDNLMRAIDIQTELRKQVRASDVPGMKQLTMALKSLHFQYGAVNGVRGWYARRIDNNSNNPTNNIQ